MPHAAARKLLSRIDAATLLDAAPDALLLVNADGVIAAANRRAPDLFAYSLDELIGLVVDELVPGGVRAEHKRDRERYADRPVSRGMGSGIELSAQRKDGGVLPVEISLSPVTIDDEPYVFAAVRDVSAARETRAELQRAQQAAALAEDRQRMARDLHDTVIQEVFAVGLGLQSLTGQVDSAPALRISQAIEDLDRVIRDIRTAIFGLTSHRDWGRGLRGELLLVAADAGRSLGFEPAISFEGSIEHLPASTAQQLVPTLREALSNVARHANARRCDVTVTAKNDKVTLTVIDDGVGPELLSHTDPQADTTNPGAKRGLLNLKERASQLGGFCTFGPAEIAGSILQWTVPAATP